MVQQKFGQLGVPCHLLFLAVVCLFGICFAMLGNLDLKPWYFKFL